MPSAPASPYTGLGQANTQAVSGMQGLQNMPNYPLQQYQNVAPGMATALQGTDYSPQNTVNWGNYITGQGPGMFAQGNTLMSMGLDPQQEFYNRAFQQQQEQQRAGQSARGILSSPVGAGMEAQSNQMFNELWRNQQAQRAAQLAGAAQGMYGQGTQSILGGQALASAVPGAQLGWAGQLSGLGQAAYAQPQQNIQNWMSYLSGGSNAQQQAYANQLAAYNAKMQQQAGLGAGIGQALGTAGTMAFML